MDRYICQEHIDAIVGDDIKSLMSSNWKFFGQGRKTLEALKSELVRALQLTSVVIGSSIALIPTSQLLKANQVTSQLGSFISMILLYVLVRSSRAEIRESLRRSITYVKFNFRFLATS